MNDNVGEMPLEIFGDYVSDYLGVDFPWEFITPVFNGDHSNSFKYGNGDWDSSGNGNMYGANLGWGNGVDYGCGKGNFLSESYGDGIGQGICQ